MNAHYKRGTISESNYENNSAYKHIFLWIPLLRVTQITRSDASAQYHQKVSILGFILSERPKCEKFCAKLAFLLNWMVWTIQKWRQTATATLKLSGIKF